MTKLSPGHTTSITKEQAFLSSLKLIHDIWKKAADNWKKWRGKTDNSQKKCKGSGEEIMMCKWAGWWPGSNPIEQWWKELRIKNQQTPHSSSINHCLCGRIDPNSWVILKLSLQTRFLRQIYIFSYYFYSAMDFCGIYWISLLLFYWINISVWSKCHINGKIGTILI